MARLEVDGGTNNGLVYEIEHDFVVLGRHQDCQFREAFVRIGGVSRRHLRISRDGENEYFVEDLGSRNGTMLNGVALRESERLYDGDVLTVCGVTLRFVGGAKRTTAATVLNEAGEESFIRASIPVSDRSSARLDDTGDANRRFKALVRLLGNTGNSLAVEEILNELLSGLFDVFSAADHGFVALTESTDGPVVPHAVLNRHDSSEQTIRMSQTIVDRALSSKEAILSLNATSDPRFDSTHSIVEHNMRTLMCAPLVGRDGNTLGVVQLETVDGLGGFNQDDLELLASVAPHAATALDYARIHTEAVQQQVLQRDLEFARQIQRNFLPQSEPELPGYRFFSHYQAAHEVGGDYFDYIQLADNRLCVIVADVAGKGISAGLLMSKFAGEFKYLLTRNDSLAAAVTHMNEALFADAAMSRFITLAAAVIDANTHQLTLVNAGHADPFLRHHDQRVEELEWEDKGTPIGMFPNQVYDETHIPLAPGDSLIMFTDGLSEAMRPDQSLYGTARIRERVASAPPDAAGLGKHLVAGVSEFVGDHRQSDDLCILCVRRDAT